MDIAGSCREGEGHHEEHRTGALGDHGNRLIHPFQEPVCLKKEVLGFAVNRLQFALLAEAWRLVSDDVLSPSDVDKVQIEGVDGRRFCGAVLLL